MTVLRDCVRITLSEACSAEDRETLEQYGVMDALREYRAAINYVCDENVDGKLFHVLTHISPGLLAWQVLMPLQHLSQYVYFNCISPQRIAYIQLNQEMK